MTKAKKATTTATKVTLFTNEYDVQMLEITGKPRNTYISLKKAQAILATNDDPSLITKIHKYGRDLFRIEYKGSDKGFTVGEAKINIVLDNAKKIAEVA